MMFYFNEWLILHTLNIKSVFQPPCFGVRHYLLPIVSVEASLTIDGIYYVVDHRFGKYLTKHDGNIEINPN